MEDAELYFLMAMYFRGNLNIIIQMEKESINHKNINLKENFKKVMLLVSASTRMLKYNIKEIFKKELKKVGEKYNGLMGLYMKDNL